MSPTGGQVSSREATRLTPERGRVGGTEEALQTHPPTPSLRPGGVVLGQWDQEPKLQGPLLTPGPAGPSLGQLSSMKEARRARGGG